MASFTPLQPEHLPSRTATKTSPPWASKIHPLLNVSGQNLLRSQLSISEWLLVGCSLQSLLILISPWPALYTLSPSFIILAFKILKVVAVTYKLIPNDHMRGVRVGRTSAVYPGQKGDFSREVGEAVGGGDVCVFILSTRCNHPLGILHQPFKEVGDYAARMFRDVNNNAEEFGFLGQSSYHSTDHLTKPRMMTLMYFKSLEYLHKFAHGKVHREGWDWWNSNLDKVNEITIAHEAYLVPAGKWETIYDNAKSFDFAATTHAVEAAGGEKLSYMCPIVDAGKGVKSFRNANARLGFV